MDIVKPKDRIIVPLDTTDLDEVRQLVRELTPYVWGFKLGLELCSAHGALKVIRIVHGISGSHAKIFLDHKLHDIPNTVAGAARASGNLEVNMFTVHASGGIAMMKAAVDNCGGAQVLAVTVLTSLTENECLNIFGRWPQTAVVDFARMAILAGVYGIVCSPKELATLADHPEFVSLKRIVPGIRPDWAATNDQKRILTPAQAIRVGATYLVIGRPITNPPSDIGTPVDAVKRIIDEIAEAQEGVQT